jgi:hypothetical protein
MSTWRSRRPCTHSQLLVPIKRQQLRNHVVVPVQMLRPHSSSSAAAELHSCSRNRTPQQHCSTSSNSRTHVSSTLMCRQAVAAAAVGAPFAAQGPGTTRTMRHTRCLRASFFGSRTPVPQGYTVPRHAQCRKAGGHATCWPYNSLIREVPPDTHTIFMKLRPHCP